MNMRNLYTQTLAVTALASATLDDGANNGATVDLGVNGNDFRDVLFVISTGTITDGSHAVTVQESANGTDWVPVPSNRILGSLPTIVAADDDKLFQVGARAGTARYVRLLVTTSGATDGGVVSAVAILGSGSNNPVARA
jgi:hypothetical protein